MSDRRIEKVILLDYVKEQFQQAPFAFFITYTGLTVAAASALRNQVLAAGGRVQVLKNRYVKLGIEQSGTEVPDGFKLSGDTAVVFGSGEDPVPVAKVIKEFAKDHEQVTFKGGLVEGKLLDASGAQAMAEMPSKEVILSCLLATIKGPASQLVRVLSTRKNSLVWLLENYVKKLEESA